MTPQPPPVAWSWSRVLLGLAYVAPAAAVALTLDPARGLVVAVGVLPAAALPLRGPRRRRALVVLVGAVAGVSLLLGSLVGGTPPLAVLTILALCVAVATATAVPERRLAPLALGLGVPLVGAGLSLDGPAVGAEAAALLVGGSVYAWLVSLAWPVTPAPPRAHRPPPSPGTAALYGLQVGFAGATAAALGFAAGIDHPGWAPTAALLVSRPRWDALRNRGVGRAVAVLAGALLACAVAATAPPPVVLAAVAVVAIGGAAATAGSRWYVLPFFSTLLVLSLLLVHDDAPSTHWFVERVGETLVGVGLAISAAWLVPRVAARIVARSAARSGARQQQSHD
ncbi:FUSC family protein [Cellulosimicrobium sp. E-16]|uniref:FUSC family protein n=1 Tax=Cellulosimicrobium sp. E-16 TaxID=3404049 RepID=UPI003CEF305F